MECPRGATYVPINEMLTTAERKNIRKSRHNETRHLSLKERKVILESLKAYKNAGSEDSYMIECSVTDILGLY